MQNAPGDADRKLYHYKLARSPHSLSSVRLVDLRSSIRPKQKLKILEILVHKWIEFSNYIKPTQMTK